MTQTLCLTEIIGQSSNTVKNKLTLGETVLTL
nr:MAG TPA: hypothetical protein [Bacteriophage sp.]